MVNSSSVKPAWVHTFTRSACRLFTRLRLFHCEARRGKHDRTFAAGHARPTHGNHQVPQAHRYRLIACELWRRFRHRVRFDLGRPRVTAVLGVTLICSLPQWRLDTERGEPAFGV